MDPFEGTVLAGRFTIERLIAAGGMGRVYRAIQAPLDRVVALKTLSVGREGSLADEAFKARFFNEASVCAKLTHPNTLRIYDFGETEDGVYFIAMEFIDGRTLHDVIEDDGPLEAARVCHIARQVCASLQEAHEHGVVHRDIKPANILLASHSHDEDFVKVVDFGLVKQTKATDAERAHETQAGVVLGSPMYMSPEQVSGERELDGRTDVYALGVVLFCALTGEVPFDRLSMVSVMMAHMHAEIPAFREVSPDIELPAILEWITRTAMSKAPEDRFADMAELGAALRFAEEVIGGRRAEEPLSLDAEGRVCVASGRLRDLSGSVVPVPRSEAPVEAGGGGKAVVAAAAGGAAALGVAVVVVLLLGLGAAGLWWSSQGGVPDLGVGGVTAAPERPTRLITVASEPRKARVFRDGELLGTTPLAVPVAEGEPVEIVLKAFLHADLTVTLDGTVPKVTGQLGRLSPR